MYNVDASGRLLSDLQMPKRSSFHEMISTLANRQHTRLYEQSLVRSGVEHRET